MQHIPISAKTNAPAYNDNYLECGSTTIAAVRPTPELPLPVVYTALGAKFDMLFNNWDLAIPGSPIKATLISPLILTLSWVYLVTPPAINNNSAFLTFYKPYI